MHEDKLLDEGRLLDDKLGGLNEDELLIADWCLLMKSFWNLVLWFVNEFVALVNVWNPLVEFVLSGDFRVFAVAFENEPDIPLFEMSFE